jgi:hypothetical protein
MFDIVTPDDQEAPAAIDTGVVDHCQSWLPSACCPVTRPASAEPPHYPRGPRDQTKYDQEREEELNWEGHTTQQRHEVPLNVPLHWWANGSRHRKFWPPMNTNKKLTSWGDFVFNGSGSSIGMVNGGLMAKTNVEPFQQAVNHFIAEAPLGRIDRQA